MKYIANLASLFRQLTFHYVSCRVLLEDSREKTYFLFGGFIACINTYLHAKFKNICQGEVCKIDKPPSSFIKILKNMTPRKDGKWSIFFKFEILATDIG